MFTKLNTLSEDDFLFAESDPRLPVSLVALQEAKKKDKVDDDPIKGKKWITLHMSIAEKRVFEHLTHTSCCLQYFEHAK